MVTKRFRALLRYFIAAVLLIGGLVLSGCATLSNALDTMNKEIGAGASGAIVTPKLDFYLFYSMVSIFRASASEGAAYKPGQGTVWTVKDTNNGTTTTSTLEQALLKKTGDGSEWWRLQVKSSDGSFLYEYLVGSDQNLLKVRYKDPNTGKIEEFVPDKSKESQSQQGQPQAAAQQTSSGGTAANGDKVTVVKNRQTVTVGAGTFNTEHVVYTDETQQVRDESWTSKSVPGAMVKYLDVDMKSNTVMNSGELTKIESGMTTVLNSY